MVKSTKRPVKRTTRSTRQPSKQSASLLHRTMKRLSISRAFVFALAFAVIGTVVLYKTFANPQEAKLEKFKNNVAKGQFWDDLEEAPAGSPCAGLLESKNNKQKNENKHQCTHGPDPAPPGLDVRQKVEPIRTGEDDATAAARSGVVYAATAATPSVACDGDGQSGKRVQGLYVHASDVPSRFATFAQSFQTYATTIDNRFIESSNQTGGPTVRPRWVHDANCNIIVNEVTLSPTGDDSWSNTWSELRAQGYTSTDRKYVLWEDSTVYCGIGDISNDDRAISTNQNNSGPSFARSDSGCWNYAESHELMHNLGGVQLSAPHASGGWHCTDEYDEMCYSDATGVVMTYPCASTEAHHFDCNKDDYFYAGTPPAGNYLTNHWNTATSAYLIGAIGPVTPPPPPGDTTPPTVTITNPVGGSTIGNSTSIAASSTDNVGVTRMQVYIDGQLKTSSTSSSISYSWNSRKASRGVHTITVKAYDAAGNLGQTTNSVTK